ncbi:methyl-CpG-binding domain protein 5-like [Polymixia lowei]
MDRAMKYGGLCADGTPPAEVPIGWQRKIHQSGVVYISPSGSVLACLEQAKSYLLTDGTCKCGLECPLILHKVFNFDPRAAVKLRTAEDAKADSNVTKLCIHKRKIIAVATLHRSMESQFPSSATGAGHLVSLNHQAIRNDVHNGPSNSSVIHDCKNSYKMQHYRELGSPPQRDLYSVHARSRLGGGDHNLQRSPYRSHYSGLLSPPSSTSCSSQHYGDGTPSPRPDPLRSPEPSALNFHGNPGSGHVNGERFTPLSPPSILVHSSPSSTKLSCAVAGRTNVSISPSVNAKSPNRQKSPCNFPQNLDYQHKSPPACYTQQHPPISQLPPCVVQKKQATSSEKDPLGILDPIPTKSHIRDQTISTPSTLQFSSQPQVPSMNVNILPAIVPLPSSLPVPMVKSGAVGHGLRVQHPTSVSSSPITSPVHMAGPAPIRVEEPSNFSHASISSSQHGGLQVSKLSSRSPRASVGSPRTSMPLQHLKETANQLLGGMSACVSRHPDSIGPPTPGSDGVSQNNHSLGVASHQLLDQQTPSSFPASSLLSAAAKAQLVNKNKLPDASLAAEARASGLGHPGLVGGGRQMYSDGYGISDPKYSQSAGLTSSDGQTGRAALRDKLMAQQREVLRKRKMPSEAGGDMSFNMNVQHGSGSSGYPEHMKRLLQQGGVPTNSSMAHLLHSMSHQSAQNGLSHAGHHPARSSKSPYFEESVPQMSTLQHVHGPYQLHSRAEIPGFQNLSNECHQNAAEALNMDQFARPINEMHNAALGGNLGTRAYGGQEAMRSICNPNPHRQQSGHHAKQSQGDLPFRDRTGLPSVMSNGGFNTFSESGEAGFLNSDLRRAQEVGQRRQQQQQQRLAQGEAPLQAGSFIQSQDALPGHNLHLDTASSSPMDSLLQNFQVGFPDRVLHRTVISRPQGEPQLDARCFQDGQRHFPAAQGLHRSKEVNDGGQRAEAGLGRETMSGVIARNSGDAFAASIAAVPVKLSHSVIHSPLRSYPQESVQPQSRMGRPRKKPEQNGVSPGVMGAPVHFRSPRRCTQRRQWVRDVVGPDHDQWHQSDKLLQEHAQHLNGNGSYMEMLRRRACPAPQQYAASQFIGLDSRKDSFSHMNGGGATPGNVHPRIIQSPGNSAGSEGEVAGFSSDFRQYNGHLKGQLNGNFNGHHKGNLNGCFTPDIADGKMSEDSLRSVDLPCHSQRLQLGPGTQHARELLWGQGLSFQSWPNKLRKEGQAYLCGVSQSAQSKVEPEEFHKTLKDDLEALYKTNRIRQNGGELNNYLEAAIEDAMSELNKLTSNGDGHIKTQKPKRRRLAR